MSAQDVVAVVGSFTALVAAIIALIRELRAFRKEVVAAVETHMLGVIAAGDARAGSAEPHAPELPQSERSASP